jgi:hypothetical protein
MSYPPAIAKNDVGSVEEIIGAGFLSKTGESLDLEAENFFKLV